MHNEQGQPELEIEAIKQYEKERKPYFELGKDKEKGWDSWGNVLVTNPDGSAERASLYTDPRITRRLFTDSIIQELKERGDVNKTYQLVDLGGGEGQMLHTINYQLRMEPNIPRVKSTLLDLDEEKLKEAREKFPDIQIQQGSVLSAPFEDDSVDFIVSRMAMQYFSGFEDEILMFAGYRSAEESAKSDESQYKLLKEAYRILKPGGQFVLVCPGYSTSTPVTRNTSEFWNRITAARTGQDYEEIAKEREFGSAGAIEMAAADVGFRAAINEGAGSIEWRITPQAVFDRFNIDPKSPEAEEVLKIFDLLQPCEDKYQQAQTASADRIEADVIEWEGKKAIRFPILKMVLKK